MPKSYGPNRNSRAKQAPEEVLKALGGLPNGKHLTWNSFNPDTILKLVCALSDIGGTVTMGASSNSSGLYLALRRGDWGQSYNVPSVEYFEELAKRSIDGCKLLAKSEAEAAKSAE